MPHWGVRVTVAPVDGSSRADSPAVEPSAVEPHRAALPSTAGETPWRWVVPVGLIVFVFLTHIPALDAQFVGWDDTVLIDELERHDPLTGEYFRWALTTSFGGHFQPLTWLSLGIDYEFWGLYAFHYHRTNVLLHALTTVAFYFVARRLLAAGVRATSGLRSGPLVWSAALAAALFAVHPLRAESVVWVAERRDVLSGVFYMLCVLCYLRHAMRSSGGIGWLVLAIVMCAVSLSAKATAATIALVLLVLDVYPLRRIGLIGSSRAHLHPADHAHASVGMASEMRGTASRTSFRTVLLEKVPFLLLGLAAGIRALIAQRDGGALYTLAERDLLSRLAQSVQGFVFYIWKTIWPTDLGPMYQLPPREALFGAALWISAVAALLIITVVVLLRRRAPALAAATAAYAVIVFPVLGIFQSGPQIYADRYSYISCMGFAVAVSAGFLLVLARIGKSPDGGRRAVLGLAACALVVVLARASLAQQDVWNRPLTLWARGVAVSPNSSIAHVEYGRALMRNAEVAGARRELERALELDPNDAVAWHNLGNVYRQYRGAEAVARTIMCYRRAMAIDPRRRGLHFSLATMLAETQGAGIESARLLREGLSMFPNDTQMMAYLAELLVSYPDPAARDPAQGLVWARRVMDLRGKPVDCMVVATALAETGRFDEAAATAEDCLIQARDNEDDRLVEELRRRLARFRGRRGIFEEGPDLSR